MELNRSMAVECTGFISQEDRTTMESIRTFPQTATQDIAQRQNRVLRNTYALLALSMAPTVAGALLGVQLKFSFLAGSPFIAFMLFLGVAFGFMWGIERTKNSGMGVALLLGFTFFMGLMLSSILRRSMESIEKN